MAERQQDGGDISGAAAGPMGGPLEALEPQGAVPADAPATLLDRLRQVDYKDPKAIAVIGAVAVTVGVGTYLLSKRHGGGSFFVRYGDRHMAEAGVISLGEMAEHGAAVSLPVSSEALDMLQESPMLFAMDSEGLARPTLGDAEHSRRHTAGAKRAAEWLIDHLSRTATESSTD